MSGPAQFHGDLGMATMSDRETYLARAAEARAEAQAAKLDNVRDRCLRSEAAWNEMAERADRTRRMRETLQADKDRAAAEQAAAELESKSSESSEIQTIARGETAL